MRFSEMVMARDRARQEAAAKKIRDDEAAKKAKEAQKKERDKIKAEEARRREEALRMPRQYYGETFGSTMLHAVRREMTKPLNGRLIKANEIGRLTPWEKVEGGVTESGQVLKWKMFINSRQLNQLPSWMDKSRRKQIYTGITLGITADNSGRLHVFLQYEGFQGDWYSQDRESFRAVDELVGQAINHYTSILA